MKTKSFLGGILTGLLVGAIAGVLLAPKSGKETRSDLRKIYSKISKDIQERINSLQEITQEAYFSLVDTVVSEYHHAEQLTQHQVDELTKALKSKWDQVTKSDT
jgi:gas vesicle protein